MKTHSRAKKGGELGANGEWYEGGKFIATTDHAKRFGSTPKAKVSKQQFERGKWEVAPDGKRALYPLLAGIEMIAWQGNEISGFMFNDSLHGNYATASHVDQRKEWIERYNKGERWIDAAPLKESA